MSVDKITEKAETVSVVSCAWLAAFRRGDWVRGWMIANPYGEVAKYSFARTRREAWERFCAPAPKMNPRRLSREGFKAVKKRVRLILANTQEQTTARTAPAQKPGA